MIKLNKSELKLLAKVDEFNMAAVQTGDTFQREYNAAGSLVKKGVLKVVFSDRSTYYGYDGDSEVIFSSTVVRV